MCHHFGASSIDSPTSFVKKTLCICKMSQLGHRAWNSKAILTGLDLAGYEVDMLRA